MEGVVFNIQRTSLHDGPGIRTVVFLKGCTLKCFWCHNPESINHKPELQIFSERCIGCGKCEEVCQTGAHSFIDDKGGIYKKRKVHYRNLCSVCGKCAEVCSTGSLEIVGKTMSVDEVVKEIIKDQVFYETSGGGVTFSGGEPLLQGDFLKELLETCNRQNIHTAVETAGNVPWETFEKILPFVDLFLYDIKTADINKHKRATGVENTKILENLRMLQKKGSAITVRVPVIPGVNDSESDILAIKRIIREIDSYIPIELLPYHSLGENKYLSLGLDNSKLAELYEPGEDKLNTLRVLLA